MGIDAGDMTLLLAVMRLARDLQDIAPGQQADFLKECTETAKAHVDAGGTDPGAVVRPILARYQAQLAAYARPN